MLLLLLLPVAPGKSVPIALQQEGAEPSGGLEVPPAAAPSSELGGWVPAPWAEPGGAVLMFPLSVAMQVWHPEGGPDPEEQGHTLGSGC